MVKEKRILSYFIGWLLLGFIVCFVGINKIFALTTTEYEDITYLNNYTVYYVKADYASSPLQLQPTNEYQLDQVTGFLVNIDNYSFNAGVTYNIEISMPLNTLTNANKYTVTGDNNMTCSVTQIDNTNPNFPNFTFNCPNTTRNITLNIFNSNGNYIVNTGLFRWNYTFLRKQITTLDLGILENQQSQIIDQNNQIIQGQDDIQNSIKDNLNSCHDSINLFKLPESSTINGVTFTKNNNGTFNLNGTASANSEFSIYVPINESGIVNNEIYTLSKASNYNFRVQVAFYNGTTWVRTPLNLAPGSPLYVTNTIILSNITQVRFLITVLKDTTINLSNIKIQLEQGSVATKWEPFGEEICSNKIDETNDALNNIGGALTDDSPTDMSGLGDSAGWLPAGPVDSILTLPLTLFTTLSDNLSNNTCTTVVLNLPFVNKNINLPCIKTLYDKIGITGTLFTTAGIIASCFILFNYLLSLYNWVDKTLTMRENTMPGYYDDNWGGGA